MDSGAYGSYPKIKRRRYNFGRYFRKKYGFRRSRAINPINQYTYNKTRVGRLTKTNQQAVKASFNSTIILNGTGGLYEFQTGGQYYNITTMLVNSPEFQSRVTQYSYYKISGMSVTLTRCWIDPISYGVNGVSKGFLASGFNQGMARAALNFYPNLINTNVGDSVEQADSSWTVSAFIHGAQSHYQPFPANFTTGSNSQGLGVWNACNAYANLLGQLSIYNDPTAIPSDQDSMFIWDIEVNLYMQFCNNTGA